MRRKWLEYITLLTKKVKPETNLKKTLNLHKNKSIKFQLFRKITISNLWKNKSNWQLADDYVYLDNQVILGNKELDEAAEYNELGTDWYKSKFNKINNWQGCELEASVGYVLWHLSVLKKANQSKNEYLNSMQLFRNYEYKQSVLSPGFRLCIFCSIPLSFLNKTAGVWWEDWGQWRALSIWDWFLKLTWPVTTVPGEHYPHQHQHYRLHPV